MPDATPRADARAAMQRALAFVESAGDELSIARARSLFDPQSAARVIELLRSPEFPPPLSRSLRTLAILDDIRCTNASAVESACEQLAASQHGDGSWSDGKHAPEQERILNAGMIAGYLAKTPFVRQSTLDLAADYLAARFEPDRVKGPPWAANAAYFHCFALVGHAQSDAILQWCGRELERGFRTKLNDALCTARVFVLCRARALPGSRLSAAELVRQILDEQMSDGGYASPEGESRCARVVRTLDALVALARLT